MLSYWERKSLLSCKSLIVVGGGIVGLSAAIFYKRKHPEADILVVEKGWLPSGASTKNAGFACFGTIGELEDDFQNGSSLELIGEIAKSRFIGLKMLRDLHGDDAIKFEPCGGYELFDAENQMEFELCKSKLTFWNNFFSETLNLQDTFNLPSSNDKNLLYLNKFTNAIFNKYEGAIDTGKMIRNLIVLATNSGIALANGVGVEKIDSKKEEVYVTLSNNVSLRTNQVIIATNGFTKRLFPKIDVNPARSQVLLTEPIPNLKLNGTFHFDKGYFYFRNIGNRILLGGGRNIDFQTESTDQLALTKIIQEKLEYYLYDKILPTQKKVKIENRWSGIMGIGKSKKPIICELSKNVFAAVRMGGMGIAIGTLVGEKVADLALDNV